MIASRMFTAVDTHTEGEATRIVTGGMPAAPGATMAEKRAYLQERLDHVRRMLLFEPRGHKDMFGAFLLPPCRPEADAGVVFMDSGSYLNMCGHGSIGVVTALLETGMVPCAGEEADVTLDTPSGLIRARAKLHNGRVREVTVRNVPAFLYREGVPVALSDGRTVHADIAFGGNFFALVEAEEAGVALDAADKDRLTARGAEIRDALNAAGGIAHPLLPHIRTVDLVEFCGPARDPRADARNVVVFGDGQIDRSPCGTGTSAKLALLRARGELPLGKPYVHESILGTLFTGVAAEDTAQGGYPAIVPEITGRAYVTGLAQYLLDPEDPLGGGFLL
ncbi:proline racemase family protein [Anaerotruncus massiliensis (ex Togo et al. 2019)]|uniref:proline racemase family protein n=1 Tax=Anaerotruncus massiliensis (ex Togo et al. 2019) TaxID=1673720 RepID=UPI003A869C7A